MTDPRNSDSQHDRELDDYLAGRHALSVRYLDASRETAPPEFDATILASARAAVAGAPQRRRPRSRWRVPLAAAATMVLGVSLVSQLRDDALPEAVRSEADAPLRRQAPATSVAREAESVEMLSAESVADMVAPSAPMPAPPPAAQAKSAAPSALAEPDAQRRREENAAAAMGKREAGERRDRSAQTEMRQAAPQAHAFAPAPAPRPGEASFDDVSIVARDLLQRLQSQDIDALTVHAPPALLPRLAGVLPAFAGAYSAQVLPRTGTEAWRIAVVDEQGRTLGHASLVLTAQDWQLTALDAAPQGQP